MRIAEIYKSRQGEGLLTGTESVFVRVSGCNLRCWFCDTPQTSWKPIGDDLAVNEVIDRTLSYDCRHVVLTGGEPMLFAELLPLSAALREQGCHITIETAGTLYLPVACDLMSISPKLAGSAPAADTPSGWHDRHVQAGHAPEVVQRLMHEFDYQLKFVIDSAADMEDVEKYLELLPQLDRGCVLLMPQGIDMPTLAAKAEWLEPLCQTRGFQFCPRRHIEWYGFTPGT